MGAKHIGSSWIMFIGLYVCDQRMDVSTKKSNMQRSMASDVSSRRFVWRGQRRRNCSAPLSLLLLGTEYQLHIILCSEANSFSIPSTQRGPMDHGLSQIRRVLMPSSGTFSANLLDFIKEMQKNRQCTWRPIAKLNPASGNLKQCSIGPENTCHFVRHSRHLRNDFF